MVARVGTRVLAVIVAGVVVGAAAVLYAIAGSRPFAADRAPGRLETAIARRLVRLSIPRAERDAANPFEGDRQAWQSAADHFAEHCAACHGADGRGSPIGSHMYPPVPDLASPAIQQFSDGELFSIIQNGVRWTGMPAFRSTDDATGIWKLVSFVRHVPTLHAGDLAHHDNDAGDGAAAATVLMDGTAFQPPGVVVQAGDLVEWINKDPFPHNVSADAAGLHSGDLEPDQTWRFRAATRGTFQYVCTLHPGMSGVLRVR
jgi:plastocyanin/cytochrome c553